MMLRDDELDLLMMPMIDRQNKLTVYILRKLAKRVRNIGTLLPSDIQALTRLLASGEDTREINSVLAKMTRLQVADIQNIIRIVAADAYKEAEPLYNYTKKPYIPLSKNEGLQRVIKAVQKQTTDTYRNLAKAQAFMLRDPKNPKRLIPTPLAEAYQSVVDEAVQAVNTGVVDYTTAMRRTLEQLADNGIHTVTYVSEKGRVTHQSIDSAVRRNVLDGVRAINQGVQEEIGKQVGTTGKELSVHAYSAPDHEPIQGHQFTDEEYEKLQHEKDFVDVLGNKFTAIKRPIGVWNCRHFAFAIIVGVTSANYTPKQLEELKQKNARGYTLPNGKHLSMYECTQYQRMLERKIRQAKLGMLTAKEAGDELLLKKYETAYKEGMDQYKLFCRQCGLRQKLDRLHVEGYD